MTARVHMPVRRRLPALAAALIMCAGCSAGAVPEPSVEAAPAEQRSLTTTRAAVETPITIMGAGDIAGDLTNAGATAAVIRSLDPSWIFTTGDNAYPAGSPSDYDTLYSPTWGPFKVWTYPVPGNHEYRTPGAAGYVDYFGAGKVTNSVDGGLYYAWDVGNGWRAYAVNTHISTSGAQLAWLRADIAAHPDRRYILYGHHPRYTSGADHAPADDICPLWNALATTGGLEIVLGGHSHQYERFAPMNCAGRASADGARSFVIGSGGRELDGFGSAARGSEFRDSSNYGVLKLVLYETSYEWEFIASGRGQVGSVQIDTNNAGQILDKGAAGV
jgi:hypothetical protein